MSTQDPSENTSQKEVAPPQGATPKKKTTVWGNLKQFYTSPETRINALLLTGLAVAMVAYGAYDLWGKSTQKVMSNPGSAQRVKNLPGGSKGGALYEQNLNHLNQKRAQQAEQQNQTYVPTLGALHPVAPVQSVAPIAPAPAPATAPAPAPAAPKPTAYQKAEAKDAQLELMRFINEPVPTPLTTSLRVVGLHPGGVPVPGAGQQTGTAQQKGPVLAQPGHISFGELLTAMNSNEPGPVEAEIVSGRFKNAKLLGKFKREKDRLIIQFNEMTLNHQSYAISAYAIDAKTARTYVATSVNHHTLVRWGSLIAASLLGGVDNALAMSNSNTIMGNGYAAISQSLTGPEIPLYAAGNVGNVLTPIMAKRFSEPPTVREAQGAPIGLLFMKPVQ
jgi:intracellular multiplication protein IcmE